MKNRPKNNPRKNIILASESPRRKELLRQILGGNFTSVKSSYEEDNTLKMSPARLVLHHAVEKGRDVAQRFDSGIVISADTLVICGGKILGKPHTAEKASEMLKMISGRTVEVVTGIAVIDAGTGEKLHDCEITKVKIRRMTPELIRAYVASGEPLDKAGAFGIQGKGAVVVERISGCYYNVVGLPLYRLSRMLEKVGISTLNP